MATIVTRAGKGSPLTHEEVDANFTNLNDEAATKAPLANPVFTGNVGIGTASTPAVKTEISGSTTAAAQFFSDPVSGTTLNVTVVTSGALAVGQYLASPNGRVRITALGTGTGGVGTYTLDTDQTSFTFTRSYADAPTTMRLGNSATLWDRNIPYGTIEFGGAITNTGPRGYIQAQAAASASPTATGTLIFGVGQTNGAAPPRTALFLSPFTSSLAGGLSLGNSALSPRNLTITPASLNFSGRSQTIYSSGANLSTLNFSSSYIDASVETSALYGQIGYRVDSSITSGQLPSNFYISTRNASGTTAERFTIDKDGRVGIGTTAPSAQLTIGRLDGVNEGGQIDLCRSSDNASAWAVDVFGSTSTPSLRFVDNTAAAERMRIDSSGNVGIGTGTPERKLEVIGSALIRDTSAVFGLELSADGLGAASIANNDFGPITFSLFGSERMRITNSGNVGIGKTNPATALDVNGTVTATAFAGKLNGYVSSEVTLSREYRGTFAHGLGAVPSRVQMNLRCVSSQFNYAVNDVVYFNGGSYDINSGMGVNISADATNVYLGIYYLYIRNKTTGTTSTAWVEPTYGNWAARMLAWS